MQICGKKAPQLNLQDDDEYYVVVAHTEEGDIPGKAKEGKCWYSFGGEEHRAEDFSYVIGSFPFYIS